MNEIPFGDYGEMALFCVNEKGQFCQVEDDGHATWINWLATPGRAKRFDWFAYGQPLGAPEFPLREPDYYQKWPKLPKGCRMVWGKLNLTLWDKAQGPQNP